MMIEENLTNSLTYKKSRANAWSRKTVYSLLLVVLPVSAQADEICKTVYEYRLLAPPVDSALSASADDQGSARDALESKLNALGADGWQLLSHHSVRVHTEDTVELGLAESARGVTESGKAPIPQSIAELVPAAALFGRETSRCQSE